MNQQYDVRCFRKQGRGELRHGLWVMTRHSGCRGLFIHGDRNEFQAPRFCVEDLARWAIKKDGFHAVEAITPCKLLVELEDWPEAQDQVQAIFDRHPVLTEVAND